MVNILIKAINKSAVPSIWAQMLEIPNILVTIRVIGKCDLRLIGVLEDFQVLFKIIREGFDNRGSRPSRYIPT